jgi:prophage regulatory protein
VYDAVDGQLQLNGGAWRLNYPVIGKQRFISSAAPAEFDADDGYVNFYWACQSSERTQEQPFMRIIRLKEVMDLTGLARSTVYKYIAASEFPVPVSLGERCVGWLESEVHDWILARVAERDRGLGLAS